MTGQADRRRNVVVIGSGRSGTSMVAGLISTAGYHMGRHLVRASQANPRGFSATTRGAARIPGSATPCLPGSR